MKKLEHISFHLCCKSLNMEKQKTTSLFYFWKSETWSGRDQWLVKFRCGKMNLDSFPLWCALFFLYLNFINASGKRCVPFVPYLRVEQFQIHFTKPKFLLVIDPYRIMSLVFENLNFINKSENRNLIHFCNT
jgi:hypothetical protein